MLVHAPCKPGHPISEDSPVKPNWDYPLSKVKTEKAIQKANSTSPEEKRDWEAPHYDTIQEMEEAIPGLIESLSAEDPNIRYGSKKAVHNYRELIKNMGDLYRDYLMTY